jgi:hypothetical protein
MPGHYGVNVRLVTALILSIIALVFSVVSLGWQVWSWSRSGPVVKVTTGFRFLPYGDRTGGHHIYIRAHNEGRTSVQVTGCGLRVLQGDVLVQIQPSPGSTPLPYTLGNGAEGTWYLRKEGLEKRCAALGVQLMGLRGQVSLGTGATVVAKERGIGQPSFRDPRRSNRAWLLRRQP